MFDHHLFDKYAFDEIPLNRDLYLMDEIWMNEYEESLLAPFQGLEGEHEPVGYISYAAARSIEVAVAELSWYANIYDRFHEVRISLPRDQFVACVGSWQCDEKPHIFVKSNWLEHMYLQSYSTFALIDAIGVKQALRCGSLTREKLIQLRNRIDVLAVRHPDISFISFADNVLLKSNWHVGMYNHEIQYSYAPEMFIRLISEIQSAYREVLGLDVYAVLTQGSNAYYEDSLLHISDTRNHISLNSLGLPFAQLMSIDKAATKAIREARDGAEVYMDERFFHSLDFIVGFDKDMCRRNTYREPMTGENGMYFYANCQYMLEKVRKSES